MTFWLVLGYAVSMTASNLCFKMVHTGPGWNWSEPGMAWAWFFAGNVAGFFCPILITIALKQDNAQVIYALCLGIGFCLVQLGSFFFFREPLSWIQWSGITLIGLGVFLLQLKPAA